VGALRTLYPSRWPGLVVLAAALVVVPTRLTAFTEPKTLVLAAAAVVSLALALAAKRASAALVPALLFGVATVTSALAGDGVLPGALALQLACAGLLIAWTITGVDLPRVVPLAVAAGTLVAGVAVAQALGADPFVAFVPDGRGTRLEVYGTLGNPDFVAAFVAPTLALSLALRPASARWRTLLALAVALQGLALVASRSFGTVLALLAALAAVLLHSRRGASTGGAHADARNATRAPFSLSLSKAPWIGTALRLRAARAEARNPTRAPFSLSLSKAPWIGRALRLRSGRAEPARAATNFSLRSARTEARPWAALVLAALALVGALTLAPRDAARALEGRLYLWQVALPHVAEAPLLGHGPGAVQALWSQWEADAWATGRLDAAARRFAADQDHLHGDALERLLEGGLLGLLALVALVAAAVRRALQAPRPLAAGVLAALASLLARSAVDFPLARPAELGLFALLCAAALSLSPAAREEPRT